jgi:hypothetical protein
MPIMMSGRRPELLGKARIGRKGRRARVDDDKVVVHRDIERLFHAESIGRRIEHTAVRHQRGRLWSQVGYQNDLISRLAW